MNTKLQVPYFNAPIYLENKSSVGKVDEILGPINQVYFTIKTSEGIQATSFQSGDKVYIAGDKLLPLERFLPKPKPPPGTKGTLDAAIDAVYLSSLAYSDTSCRHVLQSRNEAEDEVVREAGLVDEVVQVGEEDEVVVVLQGEAAG